MPSIHFKTDEESEYVHNNIERNISNYEMSSQASMTTSSQAQDAHLIWISIVQLLIMILLSHNQHGIHCSGNTTSLFLDNILLVDSSMTNKEIQNLDSEGMFKVNGE